MEKDTKTCEEVILKYIKKNKPVRSKDIVKALTQKDLFGKATITRHLISMTKEKLITPLEYPAYLRYGIQSEDKKAIYYVLAEDSEEVEHYNTVIQSLGDENKKIRNNALVEIESSPDFNLLPEQLTRLSYLLKKENDKACYTIVRIIRDHSGRGIFASNLQQLQNNLIKCFKKYNPKIKDGRDNLTDIILQLLGILENDVVIDFLEEEIRKSNILEHKIQRYSLWELSPLIIKNRTRLFKLSNQLSEEKSKAIFTIRNNAKNHIEAYKQNLFQMKSKIPINKK